MSSSESGISELERELLGKCVSSDEWLDSTPAILPRGFTMPLVSDTEMYLKEKFSSHDFKITFENCTWHVRRVCPCGKTKCSEHIIPSETEYTGSMTHEGTSLSRKFSKLKTMTTKEAKAWWAKYPGNVIMKPGSIYRKVLIPWPYEFPTGHELTGMVDELKADEIVHNVYNKKYPNNQRKYEIVGNKVFQLCQCGLKECTVHVIPSTVKIKASFKLEMHVHTRKRGKSGKRKKIPPVFFGENFRKMEALTLEDTRDWFLGVGLNYTVEVMPQEISLKMICKCGSAFETTPCEKCAKRDVKPCDECGTEYRKRMLKKYQNKRICGNCRRKKISFCDICKKDQPLDHPCLPLVNQHYSGRINKVYPPLIRQQGADFGICIDCKKGVNQKVYHRHSYRQHSDLTACSRYNRRYTVHFCHYCGYSNCDITNVREHEKFHYLEKQHKCYYCDLKFSRASSRALHHQTAHHEFSGHTGFRVTRQGGRVVRERKIGKIVYLA
jgi:hypothetical protein